MRVVFTTQAKTDLAKIVDCIAKDNPAQALTFLQKLQNQAVKIGEMPNGFQLVPRYEHFGIRRRPFGNYLIFYRVEDDRVVIIHILHGSMDYEAVLFEA